MHFSAFSGEPVFPGVEVKSYWCLPVDGSFTGAESVFRVALLRPTAFKKEGLSIDDSRALLF